MHTENIHPVSSYDPQLVAGYFDRFGENEWQRLVRTPVDEISLYLHTHYLQQHIQPGQHVLEIGAGAGRFTQVLAGLGAQVRVADISPGQLELNRRFAAQYDFEHAVLDRRQVDICDLSIFEAGAFDAVVAYGGPFSYVLDRRDTALAECLRVLKPGRLLFVSVMSLWGSIHYSLPGVLDVQPETNRRIVHTGDISSQTYPQRQDNFMHLFRAGELLDWLCDAGLQQVAVSASGSLAIAWGETLHALRADEQKWSELLRLELEACADPACQGLGTHIIAVMRRPA